MFPPLSQISKHILKMFKEPLDRYNVRQNQKRGDVAKCPKDRATAKCWRETAASRPSFRPRGNQEGNPNKKGLLFHLPVELARSPFVPAQGPERGLIRPWCKSVILGHVRLLASRSVWRSAATRVSWLHVGRNACDEEPWLPWRLPGGRRRLRERALSGKPRGGARERRTDCGGQREVGRTQCRSGASESGLRETPNPGFSKYVSF